MKYGGGKLNNATKIKYYIESLCIYNIKNDEIIDGIYRMLSNIDNDKVLLMQSQLFALLSRHKSLRHYVSKLILTDDNVFTKAAAAGKSDQLDPTIMEAVKSDLQKLEAIADGTVKDVILAEENKDIQEILRTMPSWKTDGKAMLPLTENWAGQIDELIDFYKNNGYGKYAKFNAFTWRNRELEPITSLDPITLADLKNYETQRKQVLDNTIAFLRGLPANNTLLYGDRGTGKSSTIHAILNEYHNMGLRMIEISKSDINDLTMIRERISDSPMKFIIYIDDLSFDTHDDSFGELKAALEGSLSGRQSNILIYATSNRRHLIKESFSDRENDVNRSDTMQENLSLSDRFGLSVTFLNPDKTEYQDIVAKIAADRGLRVDMDALVEEADQWARRRGGRSPRCAKQFVDYVESREIMKNKS